MITIYNPDGTTLLEIEVDDDSYGYKQIMGKDAVTVNFSRASYLNIPTGSYIEFNDTEYTLLSPSSIIINHRRDYKYTLIFESAGAYLNTFRVINPVDGRLKFPLTATAQEHLNLLVANLNLRDSGWEGTAIDTTQKPISYNLSTGLDILNSIASTFETECEIIGKHIYIGKVEHNKSNPISLSYGSGNGFLGKISRMNHNENDILAKVYIQGGERNIVKADYGATTLHLPKSKSFYFDGKYFQGETGYGQEGRVGVAMETDDDGYSVALQTSNGGVEGSLDLSEIYPHRNGRLTGVLFWDTQTREYVEYSTDWTEEDWKHIQVDVVDSQIPSTLDYDACQIEGQKMVIHFDSGQLSGKDFDIQKYYHDAILKDDEVVKPGRRFELVKADYDGYEMPGRSYVPVAGNGTTTGDQYGIFNCSLPQVYVSDDTNFGGAEYEALREAAKFLYENMTEKFSYKGELDSGYSARNWENISSRIVLGGFVSFTDEAVQTSPFLVRIFGIKTYLNRPHCPVIELSNDSARPGMKSTIKTIANESVALEEKQKQGENYTRRSFRDAKETAEMLIKAALDGFEPAISPIAIQTMQMLVGDEALQFRYWTSRQMTTPVSNPVSYDAETKILAVDDCVLQHCTLGISDIKPLSGRAASEFKMWDMYEFSSDLSASDPSQAFYLYARCQRVDDTSEALGEYLLSPSPIGMTEDYRYEASVISEEGDFYYFLVGILNSERDNSRSFAPMYGFTEVLPGQITTDVVRSSSGQSYFDLASNRFRVGDNTNSLSWNENANGRLLVKGGIVQSPSGDNFPVPCNRGDWATGSKAYYGDLFFYEGQGWLCIAQTAVDEAHAVTTAPVAGANWQLYSKKGGDGQAGTSPYSLDLSNGNMSVNADASGVIYPDGYRPSCTAKLYYGSSPATGVTYSISVPSGTTGISINSTTGVITLASGLSFSGDAIEVTVTAKIANDTKSTAILNITKAKAGINGTNGTTPHIGSNGNWWIGTTDTGIKAEGVTPEIGENGHWWIGGTDTGKIAVPSNGVGISSVTEHYAIHTSGTTAPTTGWGTTFVAPTATKPFLWNYETINYTDGSTQDTLKVVVGNYAEDGTDGKGIASIVEHYAISASNTTAPTSWSDTFVAPTAEKPYVWNYETINYTTGNPTNTTPAIIGVRGKDAHEPRISSTTGNWEFWSEAQGGYVDSGHSAAGDDGHSPYIGANGNWREWNGTEYVDTGIKAEGVDGDDAVSYEIRVSADQITVDKDGNPSPSSISATAWKIVGAQDPVSATDVTIKLCYIKRSDGTRTTATIASSVNITSSIINTYSHVVFGIYKNNALWGGEEETIPIIRDGQDGQNGGRGPTLRGPVDLTNPLSESRWFYSGKNGEAFQDLCVRKEGNSVVWYACETSYQGNSFDSTKWSDGSAYRFVATEILFAVQTLIKNGIIEHLLTANSGARIEAWEDWLKMFDTSNNEKLLITGEDIELAPPTITTAINEKEISDGSWHSGSGTRTNTETTILTFSKDSAHSIITVGQIDIDFNIEFSGYDLDGQIMATAVVNLYRGSTLIGEVGVASGEKASGSNHILLSVNTYQFSNITTSGTYYLKVQTSFQWGSLSSGSSFKGTFNVKKSALYLSKNIPALTSIGANGVSISNGNGFISSFGVIDGIQQVVFQGRKSDGRAVGILINPSGVFFNQGNGWELVGTGGSGGGGGSTVSWNQIIQSGTQIASITIDGMTVPVYAPSGTSGNYLPTSGGTMTGDISMGANKVNLGSYGSIYGSGNDVHIDARSGSGQIITNRYFYDASDERLKDIIKSIDFSIDDLRSIPKVLFAWKDDETKREQIGTIAQGLKYKFPQLVTIDKNGMYAVNYDALGVLALHGIDLLAEENRRLEERLRKIEEKLGL